MTIAEALCIAGGVLGFLGGIAAWVARTVVLDRLTSLEQSRDGMASSASVKGSRPTRSGARSGTPLSWTSKKVATMNAFDVAVVIICATVVTAAAAFGANWTYDHRRKLRVADLRPEPTPVERPALNPANRPLVTVLYGLAGELARTPDALRDVARTIQLHETEPVKDEHRERIGRVLADHALTAQLGAEEVWPQLRKERA